METSLKLKIKWLTDELIDNYSVYQREDVYIPFSKIDEQLGDQFWAIIKKLIRDDLIKDVYVGRGGVWVDGKPEAFTKFDEGVQIGIFEEFKKGKKNKETEINFDEGIWRIIIDSKKLLAVDPKISSLPKRYIIKENGEFFYNEKIIKFDNKAAIYYKLFDIIFGQDGRSNFYSYDDINKALQELVEETIVDKKMVRKRIQNAVTNLFRFTQKTLPEKINQINVIKLQRGKGVQFTNPELPK